MFKSFSVFFNICTYGKIEWDLLKNINIFESKHRYFELKISFNEYQASAE